MPWIEPKTDWIRFDYFNVEPDWGRITGNIEFIQLVAWPYYGFIELDEMPNPTTADLPYADVLNTVESNLQKILDATGLGEIILLRPITQEARTPIWDYADLNRIETITFRLLDKMGKISGAQPRLAFRMGGSIDRQRVRATVNGS